MSINAYLNPNFANDHRDAKQAWLNYYQKLIDSGTSSDSAMLSSAAFIDGFLTAKGHMP